VFFENYKRKNRNSSIRGLLSKAITSMNSTNSLLNKKETKKIYEYIEEEKIHNIYESINSDIQKNQRFSNDFMKVVPTNLKKQLNLQENKLHLRNKSVDFNNHISKILVQKVQKSPENLLINKIDEHRMKREFIENVLDKSPDAYENRIPITNWMGNLRKSQIEDERETSFIYYGNRYNPIWVPFTEKKIKSIEVIRNPLSYAKLNNNNYLKHKKLFDSRLNETSYSNKNNQNSGDFNSNNESLKSLNSNLVPNEMIVLISI